MRKTKQKKQEKLSIKDIKDLMGENKQTYKRGRGGALRAK